jgi:zinc transport system substrate-binding protein
LLRKIESAFKGLKVVDTAKGIELREIDSHSESGHGHGKGRDPHTWLDPILVKTQAHNIYEALAQTDPANKSAYQKNLDSFLKDLDRIDQRISKVLSDLKNRKILVFHPAYGYFCDRYGLEQIPVETGGKQPSPKQLADLIEKARQIKARVIFVQPQFDESSARTIAESIQGAVVKLDPLARDYLNNLWKMAEKIAESLNDEQGQGR